MSTALKALWHQCSWLNSFQGTYPVNAGSVYLISPNLQSRSAPKSVCDLGGSGLEVFLLLCLGGGAVQPILTNYKGMVGFIHFETRIPTSVAAIHKRAVHESWYFYCLDMDKLIFNTFVS